MDQTTEAIGPKPKQNQNESNKQNSASEAVTKAMDQLISMDEPKPVPESTQPPQPTALIIKPDQTQNITKPVEIMFDDQGCVIFHNHIELNNAVRWMLKQTKGTVPQHLVEAGPEAVTAGLLWCSQSNLPPSVLNECGWIKGRLTQYASLVSLLAERHPLWGDREVHFLDRAMEPILMANKNLDQPVWAAVVRIRKLHSEIWNEYFFTIDEAKTAGIYKGNWLTYPKDMLFHKANARALRTEFASALKGIVYHEDLKEVFESKAPPAQLEHESGKVQSTDDLNKEL